MSEWEDIIREFEKWECETFKNKLYLVRIENEFYYVDDCGNRYETDGMWSELND